MRILALAIAALSSWPAREAVAKNKPRREEKMAASLPKKYQDGSAAARARSDANPVTMGESAKMSVSIVGSPLPAVFTMGTVISHVSVFPT